MYEICWNDTFDVKKLLTSCEFDMNQSQKQLTPYFFSYVVIDKSFFLSTTYNESKFLNIVLWKYLMLSLLFSFGLLSWNPTTLNTSFNNKNLAKKLKTSFLLPTITQGDLTHILFKISNSYLNFEIFTIILHYIAQLLTTISTLGASLIWKI